MQEPHSNELPAQGGESPSALATEKAVADQVVPQEAASQPKQDHPQLFVESVVESKTSVQQQQPQPERVEVSSKPEEPPFEVDGQQQPPECDQQRSKSKLVHDDGKIQKAEQQAAPTIQQSPKFEEEKVAADQSPNERTPQVQQSREQTQPWTQMGKEQLQPLPAQPSKQHAKEQQVEPAKPIEQNLLKQKQVDLEPQDNPCETTTVLAAEAGAEPTNAASNNPSQPSQQQNAQSKGATPQNEDEKEKESDGDDEGGEEIVAESPTGRFRRFGEELGHGAYKKVFKAIDTETGREVAWSVINLSNLPKSERPRIRSEINIIKKLKHPNIISFVSAWIDKEFQQIHLITEMITGGSLRQYLGRMGKLKLKVIKQWCHEVLEGLKYLHNEKIIHRDIKCDNIFINSNSGEIKIGDLGLSTAMMTTHTESVLGTPEFMAPELYEESYDTAVDIYAFGMALLEMLTREVPYRECANPAQIYRKVSSYIFPKSLDRVQDEQVKAFIMWCLEDKKKRPTAEELVNSEFMLDTTNENNSKPCKISPAPKAHNQKSNVLADHPEIQPEDQDLPERDETEENGKDFGSEKKPIVQSQKHPSQQEAIKAQPQQAAPSQKQPQHSEAKSSQVTQATEVTQITANVDVVEKQNQDMKSEQKQLAEPKTQSPDPNKRRSIPDKNQTSEDNVFVDPKQIDFSKDQQQQKNQKIKKNEESQSQVEKKPPQAPQSINNQIDAVQKDAQEEKRKLAKQERNIQKSHRAKNNDPDRVISKERQNQGGGQMEKSAANPDGHRQGVKHHGLYPIKKDFKEDDDSKPPQLMQYINQDPAKLGKQVLSPRRQKKENKDTQQKEQVLENQHEQSNIQSQKSSAQHGVQDVNKKQRDENQAPALEKSSAPAQQQKGSLPKSKTQKPVADAANSQKPMKPAEQKSNADKRHSTMAEPNSTLIEQQNPKLSMIQKQEAAPTQPAPQSSQNEQIEKIREDKSTKPPEQNKPLGAKLKRKSKDNLMRAQQEFHPAQPQDQDPAPYTGCTALVESGGKGLNQSRNKKVLEQSLTAGDVVKKQSSREITQVPSQIHHQNVGQVPHIQSTQVHHQNIVHAPQPPQGQLHHQNVVHAPPNSQVHHQSLGHVAQAVHKHPDKVIDKNQSLPQHKSSNPQATNPHQLKKETLHGAPSQMMKAASQPGAPRSQKQSQQAVHSKEPETIQMKITVKDNDITFDYQLKQDTPEVVAREFVLQMNLDKDKGTYEQFRNEIQNKLENYYKNKKIQAAQDSKVSHEQQSAVEQQQTQVQPPEKTIMKEQQLIPKKTTQTTGPKAMKQQVQQQQPQEAAADVSSNNQLQTSTKKQGGPTAQPQDKFDKLAFEDPTRQKGQKQPTNAKGQNQGQQARQTQQSSSKQIAPGSQQIKSTEIKKGQAPAQPHSSQQTQQNAQSVNQNQNTQPPAAQAPPHHTPEFLKKRDELKKVYKDMNNGIMKFFRTIKAENMSIDQVLDAMDYQDQKDREFKHKYINKLMEVETEFLNKKHNTHKQPQKHGVAQHVKEGNAQVKQQAPSQHKQSANGGGQQAHKASAQQSAQKATEKQAPQAEVVNNKPEQPAQSQPTKQPASSQVKSQVAANAAATQQAQMVKKTQQQKQGQQQTQGGHVGGGGHQTQQKQQQITNPEGAQQSKADQQQVKSQQKNVQQSQQDLIRDAQIRINRIKKAFQTGRQIEVMIQTVGQNLNNTHQGANANQHISPTKQETIESTINSQMQAPIDFLPVQENGLGDLVLQEEIKKIQDKLQIEQDGVVTRGLVQKMDQYLEKLNYKYEQKNYQFNQLKKQSNQQAQKPQQVPQQITSAPVGKPEEQKQSEIEAPIAAPKNQKQVHSEKSGGLMTEISKPQQESNQSTQTKIQILQNEGQPMDDEYGEEGSKKVAQEQGSSGTFNNSRAQDDGYDPDIADTTIITYNSNETSMQEKGASSTKQVLAELMDADNHGGQQQQLLLQGQSRVGSQAQATNRQQPTEAEEPTTSHVDVPAPAEESSQPETIASTQNQQGKDS